MATYYVNGSISASGVGTSWATAKKTISQAEALVSYGDTVYVGPGAYRETVTLLVSGSAGSPINFIGDISGAVTDGVGGIVRITGSDNDQSTARASCIISSSKSYRTFKGFYFDTCSSYEIDATHATNFTFQDCTFMPCAAPSAYLSGSCTSNTFERCFFHGHRNYANLSFISTVNNISNSGNIVQNCIFIGGAIGVYFSRVFKGIVKNCTFIVSGGGSTNQGSVVNAIAVTAGQSHQVCNNIFQGASSAVYGSVSGDIDENYNTFYANGTARTNTATGANSLTYPALLQPAMLTSSIKYPWDFGALTSWSKLIAISGSTSPAPSTDDFYGITRPVTSSKDSWGAIQYQNVQRTSASAQAGTYSIDFPDAGETQFFVPTDGTQSTFSVYVYRGAYYTGTNPQMIIHQPGQSDITVTDTGNALTWNQLSQLVSPSASPCYCVVELRSNNTATSGSGTHVCFDTFART